MQNKYILLVEDDPDDIELTIRSFRKNHIMNEIVVMKDGAEALDFLFGTGTYKDHNVNDLPAVILMDIKLPKIDGLEALKRIRQDTRTRLVPVVIVTSSKEEQDVVNGYKLGANSYIHKPVDFEKFTEVVRQLGLYWLLLNEPLP